MTEQEKDKLFEIRGKVLKEIIRQRSHGEPGKMSDGNIAVTLYIDANGDVSWKFWLYCYLIGPQRQYEWYGKTLMDTLTEAEKDIDKWILEEIESDD